MMPNASNCIPPRKYIGKVIDDQPGIFLPAIMTTKTQMIARIQPMKTVKPMIVMSFNGKPEKEVMPSTASMQADR